MAAFATVDNTNLQSEDMGNEIILSYSEHRQILGQSAVDAVITGDDMQDKTLWLAMQAWLESNCVSFVNHSSPPDMFTLATWRAVAGLNASGFSRYVENVLTGYGNIAKGYDRSIVNFQELQKGLDALRWTKGTVTWSNKGETGWQGGSTEFPTWGEAKGDAEAYWAPFGSPSAVYAATNGSVGYGTGGYLANGMRSHMYAQASDIVTVIQHSAELWMKPKAWAYGNPPNLIFDANWDIVGSAGVWGLEFSLAEAATATREQVVGSASIFPVWCDEPTIVGDAGRTGRGWMNDEDIWILKWNGANGFSYTL